MDKVKIISDLVQQVCPIVGVSIGRADDPQTWRIDFADEATEGQRLAAASVLIAWGPLGFARQEKIEAIDAERDRLLKAGKLYGGLHVALLDKHGTDGPRADLGGMGTTAIGILVGVPGLVWPASFQLGWISVENTRIPLADPAAGLALAAAAGDYFAAVVQRARDKKDACLAADDQAALDAVSVLDDWPDNIDPAGVEA